MKAREGEDFASATDTFLESERTAHALLDRIAFKTSSLHNDSSHTGRTAHRPTPLHDMMDDILKEKGSLLFLFFLLAESDVSVNPVDLGGDEWRDLRASLFISESEIRNRPRWMTQPLRGRHLSHSHFIRSMFAAFFILSVVF